MNKPTLPCYDCGENDWWQRPDGGWNCGKCHPNPNPEEGKSAEPEAVAAAAPPGESHVEPVRAVPKLEKKSSSLEVLTLMERVRRGNDKLNIAWSELLKTDHGSQTYKDEVARWFAAKDKLVGLGHNLQSMGFHDCLYLDKSGKKTRSCLISSMTCLVCPSTIKYWEKELMELPANKEVKDA
ncbi:hypothetical protein ES703_98101 [subsurface metagenome]